MFARFAATVIVLLTVKRTSLGGGGAAGGPADFPRPVATGDAIFHSSPSSTASTHRLKTASSP